MTNKEKNFVSAVVYLHNDGARAAEFCALLVKELRPGVLGGRRWYFHESSFGEACADEAAAAAFDATFPPKEKRWQPSQEEFYIHSHSSIGD